MNSIISELDAMCWAVKFDQDRAVDLLKCIDPNEVYDYVPPHGGIPYRTTLLYRAVSNQNVDMMELLLENGADPNFVDAGKTVFYGVCKDCMLYRNDSQQEEKL